MTAPESTGFLIVREAVNGAEVYAELERIRDERHIPLSRKAQRLVRQHALPAPTPEGYPVTKWVGAPILGKDGWRVTPLRLRGVAGAKRPNELGEFDTTEIYLEELTTVEGKDQIRALASFGTEAMFEGGDVRLWGPLGTGVVSFEDPATISHMQSGDMAELPPASPTAVAELDLRLTLFEKAL